MVQRKTNGFENRNAEEFIGFTIVRLAHLLNRRMDAALQDEAGITVRQFGALNYLDAEPGIGSAELARKLMITPQSTGPLIDSLVAKGYVERTDDVRKGQRKPAKLSKEGQMALARGYSVAEKLRAEEVSVIDTTESGAMNRQLRLLLEYFSSAVPVTPSS